MNDMQTHQSQRIQTSVLNGMEKRALVYMANRMPRWVTSDHMTWIGIFGAFLVGLGFFLTNYSIYWLWLSSAGLVINWFGDSLDGTIARVRDTQRPLYGYYLDHTVDCINEGMMFLGAGLSHLVRLDLALAAFILYLFMTINVSINAHLKGEFRLTYAKMGPTEFRLVIIISNILLVSIPALTAFTHQVSLLGSTVTLHLLDLIALGIILLLALIYLFTVIHDARWYAKKDPKIYRG